MLPNPACRSIERGSDTANTNSNDLRIEPQIAGELARVETGRMKRPALNLDRRCAAFAGVGTHHKLCSLRVVVDIDFLIGNPARFEEFLGRLRVLTITPGVDANLAFRRRSNPPVFWMPGSPVLAHNLGAEARDKGLPEAIGCMPLVDLCSSLVSRLLIFDVYSR